MNDIDDARLSNLRKLGFGEVTAQDGTLPFRGESVDAVLTNPPFGTVTERVYDGIFKISSLEGQMAINGLDSMRDDGRAAIVIGGNTSYRKNGSMNLKDAAFFGYLYSHYNVVDVININGKALYSRNGTGYDVRMILIDGRKEGEFKRVIPPVRAKARAEQVNTFEELYKRVQDDIHRISTMGHQSADEQSESEPTSDGSKGASVRQGGDRADSGSGNDPYAQARMAYVHPCPINPNPPRPSQNLLNNRIHKADLLEWIMETEEMQEALTMFRGQRADAPLPETEISLMGEEEVEQMDVEMLLQNLSVVESDWQ